MKKYDQSKKAQEKFYSPLIFKLRGDERIRKDELIDNLFTTGRSVRREIERIGNHYAVISDSTSPGYRLAKDFAELKNKEEALREAAEIRLSLQQDINRVDNLKAKMKPKIAYLKALEKEFGVIVRGDV